VTDVAETLSSRDPKARAFATLLRELSSKPHCASFQAYRIAKAFKQTALRELSSKPHNAATK
jgi:hypothetical protein